MTELTDFAAEQAVLGGVLIDPAMMGPVSMILRGEPEDIFGHEENAAIYRAMLDMHLAGEPIDIVLLFSRFGESRFQMASMLSDISGSVPASANATYYARAVMDMAVRRALKDAGHQVSSCAEDLTHTPSEILDETIARMPVSPSGGPVAETASVGDTLSDTISQLETHTETGIPTGYAWLDDQTGGWQKGDVIILAARPSVGKTALALNFAYHAAVKEHKAVLFLSLEMAAQRLTERLLAIAGGVDTHRIRRSWQAERELLKLKAVVPALKAANIVINDSPSLSFGDVKAIAASRIPAGGLDLIVIDYLQLMTPRSGRENRQTEVAELSRDIKGLSRQLNVPVLVLCQLNRLGDTESPRLSHLRESGAIEHDADVVLLMARGENDIVSLDIAKQRNGPTGVCKLVFERRTQRFSMADDFARKRDEADSGQEDGELEF